MIRYVANGGNTSIRYAQENNIIERFLWRVRANGDISWHLESCNVCAVCCAVEAIGALFKKSWRYGTQTIAYDDMLFYMLQKEYAHAHYQPNEVAQCLAWGAQTIAHVNARVVHDTTIADMCMMIDTGSAIVQSYKTRYGSGHYICLIGYDDTGFIYMDSWSSNPDNKNGGVHEHMSYKQMRIAKRPYLICIEKMEATS